MLTADAFDELLRRFHPERECAGAEYEALRRRLLRFFEVRGSESPEEDADETLNRLARKVVEGEQIQRLWPFALAIARFVNREGRRRRWIVGNAQRLLRYGTCEPAAVAVEEERRARCWQRCLSRLSPPKRELLEAYYQVTGSPTGERREALATERGLSVNGLRIQVFRIKASLRSCAARCVCEEAHPPAAVGDDRPASDLF